MTIRMLAIAALVALTGAVPAFADEAQPLPSPRPIPDWITGPLACGGVKMGPVPAPGLSVNPEPTHAVADWYPDGPGSTNPCARHNFVLRLGRGHYLVWFPMATPLGRVGVGPTCTVTSVAPSPLSEPGTDVRVTCSVDSRFTVRF